jgi:CheY-like chemotaxis protein
MSPTILLVEDEPDVLDFLLRAVERIAPGATLLKAANGADALALFQRRPCSLVISDHRMPLMTGLELLVALRGFSSVPFIMLSADTLIAPQAYAAGVSEFLEKPMSLQALRAAVRRYIP